MNAKRINEPVGLENSSIAVIESVSFCPGQPLKAVSLTFNWTDSVTNEFS